MLRSRAIPMLLFAACGCGWGADFAREVQPILHQRCAPCHSGAKPAGGLNVVTRADLLRGGVSGPAIRAGAADSLLIRRVTAEASRMPLGQPPLADREVAMLREWIENGALWNPDSAMTAVSVETRVRPVRPVVPAGDASNPIDAFVGRYLHQKRLEAAPLVDDAVYARRVYFDLIGMPPSPEDLDRFVRNPEPRKRAVLADALLNRRQDYAEHWMTWWNDLLRNDQGVALPGEQREWIT